MHFESALNLVWLALGLIALAGVVRATFRRAKETSTPPIWLHIVGVGLIVAALFPYISATDDVVRIEHFNAQHNPQHSNKQSQADNLVRLYETMDTPLVCRVAEVVLTFFFVSLVFTPVLQTIERITPFRAGRSPPLAAA